MPPMPPADLPHEPPIVAISLDMFRLSEDSVVQARPPEMSPIAQPESCPRLLRVRMESPYERQKDRAGHYRSERHRDQCTVPSSWDPIRQDDGSEIGWCMAHQSRARSSVHVSAPATSVRRRDSSFADCGRSAGSFARHDSTSRSRPSGMDSSVRADGGNGGALAC
jgi:hypothetical protein